MIGRDEVTDLEGTRVSNIIIWNHLQPRQRTVGRIIGVQAHECSGTRIVRCRIVVTRLYVMYFLS